MADRPRLFLIDGTALAYRSYFAFIRNPLINSKGQNTSAVFGYTQSLLRLIEEEQPDRIAVVFDSGKPTFRHQAYPDYKATREKMPDEMAEQLPLIEQVTDLLGIPALCVDGCEADDVIGTLATEADDADFDTLIVTGDKDFMQLVADHVKLYDLKKQAEERDILDAEAVQEKFGAPPEKITDILGLMGDKSDNIPGVPGVGEKTAAKLIGQFGSLEAAIEHADEIKGKRARQGLQEHADDARLSKDLVTIHTDVDVDFDPEDFGRHEPDTEGLLDFFQRMEFESLIKRLQLGDAAEDSDELAYHTVTEPDEFAALLDRLRDAKEVCLDLETTSTSPMEADIVGFSFSVREREAWYVPAAAPLVKAQGLFDADGSPLDLILDQLRPILEDPAIAKGGQNIKYDMIVLANHGVELQGVAFDSMVESYLLDPSQRQHNLDLLALKHLSIKTTPISDLIGKGKDQISMADVPLEQVAPYACEDADIALRLHHLFLPQLEEAGLDALYHEVEVPLVSVLARMERYGVKVNLELLEDLSAKFAERVEALAADIYDLAGEEFNINSTQQLGAILFEKLEIHKQTGNRLRRTKTGYATSVAALEPYMGLPIIQKLLEYRSLTKLKGTYIDAFPELVNPETGKIHTSFNQTVTATGRLSSSEPNLQNIPVRTELGRQIRAAFIPASPDRRLIVADYSQVELRLVAHLSADPALLDAFQRGQDIHRRTASEIFDVPIGDVPPDLRSRAKAINFGIIYGMGPRRLAHDTGISLDEARKFIDAYFERYPHVKQFIDHTIAGAERDGYVETLLGRRRPLPDIWSQDRRLRSNAERVAVNTPIQGTAADLIKIAMVNLDRELREQFPDAWMTLQVHDELVFDVPADQTDAVTPLIRERMEGALTLDVPVKVDIHAGKTWEKS